MIDERIMEKIIPIPDEERKMEELQVELSASGFPINNFSKGGVFYMITRICVKAGIEIKQLARTIVNSCFIKHAEDGWLDVKAADFSKFRKEALKAQGYITIHRSEYGNALQITKGHMFKTYPDINGRELKYYALINTPVAAGEAIGKVLVEAEETGADYNTAVNRITISMIHLEGVDHVCNEEGWLYQEGTDIEDIESLRERCMSSFSELAVRTIAEKLINRANSVPGVLNTHINAQHPRGQATVDIIITSTAGAATQELLSKVDAAIEPLKGNYEDYLVKSSEIITQDFELVLYIAEDVNLDGIAEQAKLLIEDMMKLPREDQNLLYRDSIIKALSMNVSNYKKTCIIQPESDLEFGEDKVIVLGNLNISVKNIDKKV